MSIYAKENSMGIINSLTYCSYELQIHAGNVSDIITITFQPLSSPDVISEEIKLRTIMSLFHD